MDENAEGVGVLSTIGNHDPVNTQTVIQLNRDTLYSLAVFDLLMPVR